LRKMFPLRIVVVWARATHSIVKPVKTPSEIPSIRKVRTKS